MKEPRDRITRHAIDIAIPIDNHRKLRDVLLIEAKARNPLLSSPFRDMTHAVVEAFAEHFATLAAFAHASAKFVSGMTPQRKLKGEARFIQARRHHSTTLENEFGFGAQEDRTDREQRRRCGQADARAPSVRPSHATLVSCFCAWTFGVRARITTSSPRASNAPI